MSVKRKSTGKRLRFEIFARDGFKCRYCGRESSEVRLVVDHIKPVCQGGDSEPENLITSCETCNQGKAGKTISQHLPGEYDRLAREQELREQENALRVARQAVKKRKQIEQEIVNFVCEEYGVESMDRRTSGVLLSYFNQHGAIVFEWIQIAVRRGITLRNCGPYVSGIRRKWREEQEAKKAP